MSETVGRRVLLDSYPPNPRTGTVNSRCHLTPSTATSAKVPLSFPQQHCNFIEPRSNRLEYLDLLVAYGRSLGSTARHRHGALSRFASLQYVIAEIVGIDDTDELHVVRLAVALTGGFELEDAQVKVFEQRAFDEGDILNIFQRYRLFDLENDAFAEA